MAGVCCTAATDDDDVSVSNCPGIGEGISNIVKSSVVVEDVDDDDDDDDDDDEDDDSCATGSGAEACAPTSGSCARTSKAIVDGWFLNRRTALSACLFARTDWQYESAICWSGEVGTIPSMRSNERWSGTTHCSHMIP